ncbi:MAG TPA: 2-dehydropantoate 2-reductase N-terminal domain-containing protein [Nocardioidaceae bacterium]|nr:2-dehydropantoate 2-reductase N-terminal domain-containing protein [Nocardioidaceae bacterium]
MRFIVYGAGAIGGVIGGRLFEAGHEVVLIARREHYQAIHADGLRLESPDAVATVPVQVVDRPGALTWRADDVVLLTVKSQHTTAALGDLSAAAPATTPVVCAQNGVANEQHALRLFEHVYGVCVMCPAGHLRPGAVSAYSAPLTGILDIGRYPRGTDDVAVGVAAALESATFLSEPIDDVQRWKYRKLVTNLGNAIEAVCGPTARRGPLGDLVRDEAATVLDAAGIDVATPAEDAERRDDHIRERPIAGVDRPGGSSWQSLHRSTGAVETDYLNGEIVMLGRLHEVPTPANALLQRLANDLARSGRPPGEHDAGELLTMLGRH